MNRTTRTVIHVLAAFLVGGVMDALYEGITNRTAVKDWGHIALTGLACGAFKFSKSPWFKQIVGVVGVDGVEGSENDLGSPSPPSMTTPPDQK